MYKMRRWILLNRLIEIHHYQRYLEIGVNDPEVNFQKINCSHKDGVDPAGRCNYPMPSDKFFEELDAEITYDLIFVDGLHTEEQVDKDIENALKHLSPNGTIVVHDCNPETAWLQRPYSDYLQNQETRWTGTVWCSIAKLRISRRDLDIRVVDIETGLAIIRRGSQKIYHVPEGETLDYSYLKNNRKELLNLVSWVDFEQKYPAEFKKGIPLLKLKLTGYFIRTRQLLSDSMNDYKDKLKKLYGSFKHTASGRLSRRNIRG